MFNGGERKRRCGRVREKWEEGEGGERGGERGGEGERKGERGGVGIDYSCSERSPAIEEDDEGEEGGGRGEGEECPLTEAVADTAAWAEVVCSE